MNKFDFSKILILNKITRYEFEKKRFPNLTDKELKKNLQKKGSNFDRLIEHHNTHYRSLEKILKIFQENKLELKVIQRNSYTLESASWANCIFTAGGDGTFLLASAKVYDSTKPVIGINTDVSSSEGHLLLTKQQSTNFSETLTKLLNGQFRWLMRSRIKVYLEGQQFPLQPIELHDQVLNNYENRYLEHIEESRMTKMSQTNKSLRDDCKNINKDDIDSTNIIYPVPTLSLNEVFIGESLSARVSYYQMSIDNGPFFKQKSSGIIISTGTGSTSWCYNINKMSSQSMKKIFYLIKKHSDSKEFQYNEDLVEKITHHFNNSIVFEPNELRMGYTIRDPIINRIFQNETNRGFGKKLIIQSRCFDACLVIDGGFSYQFNDGAKAILEILPEYSLKTIILD